MSNEAREEDALLVFDDRLSDSPYVERIWRSRSERGGTFLSVAAGHCEMVVTRHDGKTTLTLRGPETRATTAECPSDAEWVGMTYSAHKQIVRARYATNLLTQGAAIVETVHEAGYFDQAHLTRSLRHLVGETPARIQRRERQLSLLYKTDPFR